MKYFFLFVSIFFLTNVQSQQNHFVFIQSETRQPFNVTINKKVYSSTASGYVIVPKLASGQYNLTVAFGGNTTPDQDFAIALNQEDAGYSLKDFPGKGWGLFNLQSLDVAMSQQALPPTGMQKQPSQSVGTNTNNKAEPAKDIFQPDVNQPVATNATPKPQPASPAELTPVITTNEKTELPRESPVATTPKPVANPQATPAANQSTAVPPLKATPTSNTAPLPTEAEKVATQKPAEPVGTYSPSPSLTVAGAGKNVNKISELKGSEAYYITYVDYSAVSPDTINLLIPISVTEVPMAATKPANEPKFLELRSNATTEKSAVVVPADLKAPRQAPQANNNTTPQPASVSVPADLKPASQAPPVDSNNPPQPASVPPSATSTINRCNAQATNDDFLQLRKQMAAAADEEGMISEARKTFKAMCFTSSQVKNLAYLFLTDEGKYRFFDAAYQYVADREAFSALSQMITDAYYLNRFKAMLIN